MIELRFKDTIIYSQALEVSAFVNVAVEAAEAFLFGSPVEFVGTFTDQHGEKFEVKAEYYDVHNTDDRVHFWIEGVLIESKFAKDAILERIGGYTRNEMEVK